jgi:hypothetical protein
VMAPSRVVIALILGGVLAILALSALLALPQALRVMGPWRWLFAVGIAVLLALLAAWVLFVAPAYWD